MKLEWKNWDDEDCRKNWRKMRENMSANELMYVLYGGLLEDEIELQGYIAGRTGYGQKSHAFEFKFKEAEEIHDLHMLFERKIPIKTIKGIAQNHTEIQQIGSSTGYEKHEAADVMFRIYFDAKN